MIKSEDVNLVVEFTEGIEQPVYRGLPEAGGQVLKRRARGKPAGRKTAGSG